MWIMVGIGGSVQGEKGNIVNQVKNSNSNNNNNVLNNNIDKNQNEVIHELGSDSPDI